ncbi:NitT/TauT family transport system substrate-binding protein [Labrys wisconsinensis]|uniref:NitT/TauT family transport system substrate-binding protein n=2 Tax=Labrys wisconsinensis TaxID=425677 RepID=A0ABU0JLP2_9HYPH|nr:ABC transporter substrate-binding protein [Labrys wisconsinensis]MDQ0475221.1 NitT/TauT family transport system substrate-binding protein [Labrys wisconsinensis]
MRRILIAAMLLAAAMAPAAAQTKIKLMVGGIDKQAYLPVKLTDQLGHFKEQGLDVELYNSNSGSQAATALLAGEVQVVVGFYDHTIDLQAKGKHIVNVAQLSISPGEVELVVAKDADTFSNPANWKGHALGVTGLGSATDFLTRYLATKAGLKPSEISTIPVGAGDTMIAALQQNRIVAGMTTEPTVSRALKMGIAKVGIDLRNPDTTRAALGGDYPSACVYVDAGWLDGNRETVQKVVNAFIGTLKWIDAHSPEDIADKMPKDYYAGDRDLYVQGLRDGKSQYSKDGVLSASAAENVLRVLKAVNPAVQGKEIDLSRTYTAEFVSRANGS